MVMAEIDFGFAFPAARRILLCAIAGHVYVGAVCLITMGTYLLYYGSLLLLCVPTARMKSAQGVGSGFDLRKTGLASR